MIPNQILNWFVVITSVSYSGQYSTLWPWQPEFESPYRHATSFYPREGCACWPYATGKWWWSVRDPTGHEGCLGSINPPLLLKKVVQRAGASQKLVDSAAAPDHHLPSRILVRGARIRMQAGLALLPLRTKFAVFHSTLRL